MKGVIYRDISNNDLLSFMDQSNVEYSIPRNTYGFIFNNKYEAKDIIRNNNMEILDEIYGDMFPNVKKALADTITPSLVYDEGWRLKITADGIINTLLYNFGSGYRFKDYEGNYSGDKIDNTKRAIKELSDIEYRIATFDTRMLYDSLSYEMLNSFNDKGRDYINLRKEVTDFIKITKYLLSDNILEELDDNNIDKQLEGTFEPKNLLYSLAISASAFQIIPISTSLLIFPVLQIFPL